MDGERQKKNVRETHISLYINHESCFYLIHLSLFQLLFWANHVDPDLWIHPNDSAVVTLNAGEIVVSDSFSAGITLRFPRITKVRYDADSKDPSNIESEESLREKYWEVQKSRSNASVESTAITLGSPDRNHIGAQPCRFLTEQQYQESLRHRKSTSRRTKQQKFVVVPQADVISKVLNGISFSVLGGTGYSLVEGTIEYDEATEQGWISDANEFYDDKSVIQFIKKHGGKYKISVDHDCKFVLGGNINDSKVVTYIRAIEHARLQSATFSNKATSKKGQELANIASSEGVLRWTFVVSLVYRWLQTNHTTTESILTTDPDFMKPSVLDYLVRPKPLVPDDGAEVMPKIDQSLYRTDISSISKMRRAMELLSTNSALNRNEEQEVYPTSLKSWRDICIDHLDESERWIASSQYQSLWPYRKGSTTTSTSPASIIVVYPDIHPLDEIVGTKTNLEVAPNAISLGHRVNTVTSDLTNDWIASTLPLLRVMGAFISKELTNDVTHILCDLTYPNDEVVYNERITTVNIFVNQHQGNQLFERLRVLQNHRLDIGSSEDGSGTVTFISPNWVRKRKWCRQ